MSEVDMNELLNKLNELNTGDSSSKINQIVMLCLEVFLIMFVMMKPLCKTWMRYKYKRTDDNKGATGTSNSSF